MQVRISETYDLSTQVGKMGLIAVHTPSFDAIKGAWGGLAKNHKFMRLVNCDITMACASMLPADPLQIGTEAGDIAPQDMFNPILFKAVSNDSYNNMVNRIMYLTEQSASTGVQPSSIGASNDDSFGIDASTNADPYQIYYSLLSDKDGWKKAMPQSGLQMKGLYPIVFSVVNTIGNQSQFNHDMGLDNQVYNVGGPNAQTPGVGLSAVNLGTNMRGPSIRMPKIPTFMLGPGGATLHDQYSNTSHKGVTPEIPKCYVAVIIMPPAKLNKLYYRLKVTWTVEFSEPRTLNAIAAWDALANYSVNVYGTDYVEQSKTMSTTLNTVDAKDANAELVMEGV